MARPPCVPNTRWQPTPGQSQTGRIISNPILSRHAMAFWSAAIRPANTRHDGHFDIPTFQEIIDFVAAEAATCGRMIGLIPEIKNATHFRLLGFTPKETFLHTIAAHEYTRYCPLEVQSFETTPLCRLHGRVQAINPQAGASHAAHGGTGGTCSRYDGHRDPAGLWQPHAPGRLTARARLCGCHRTVQYGHHTT